MKKYIFLSLGVILGVAFFFKSNMVDANPSQILETKSAAATTTYSYLTAGAATTTSTFDTQSDGGLSAESATLLFWVRATTTTSTLNINIQYSQDNIDWFQDAGTLAPSFATTTVTNYYLTNAAQYTFSFASSTADANLGAAVATISTTTRALSVSAPTRYIRAVFSVPVGAAASAIWTDWAAKKQNR